MHNTIRLSLKKGIGLTCVTTNQLKTSWLSAMLSLPLDAAGRSMSALLPYVLRSSCRDYPGRQAVVAQLDELYGAWLEPIVRKRGEAQMIGFVADVIDERFTIKGTESLFAGTTNMMSALLLHPDRFLENILSREAGQMCDRIAALADDKRSWSVRRMYQHMCAQEAYSAVEFGEIEQLRSITPDMLLEQYRHILSAAPLEFFYCGSLPPETVAQQLISAMQERPEIEHPVRPQFYAPRTVQARKVIEEEVQAKQGKLTIGLRTGITAFDADYPALIVFNACLGGTTSSRLFRTVREKMSLCYYASSQTDKLKGVMAIMSGIENDSRQKAETEILNQLYDVQSGALTQEEVEAAKRSTVASLDAMRSSPSQLENFYQTQAAAGLTQTLDELTACVQQVSVQDVTQAACKAVLDTVYFLKGAGS